MMHSLILSILVYFVDKIYRISHTLLRSFLALSNGFSTRKLPPIKNSILQMSATELARKIREKQLTSESVVTAFIERITEVEPLINATVECRFQEALAEAREADSLVASGLMTKDQIEKEKPLLGVPFSVKVIITVKGLQSTAGCLLFKGIRSQNDADSVSLMKKAGAIVITTTNCSESGLTFQSSNYIHGTTCNPYNTSRTSGASSGGESALIGAAGSVIGLGNDMAGSIRMPCLFTGIFGHKPSAGLVSNKDCFPRSPAELERFLSTGPMCRYAEDLVTAMKILTESKNKNLKFGQKVDFKNIKIYYILSLGDLPLTEAVDLDIQKAVHKVAFHFESLGSKVKLVNIPLLRHSFPIFLYALTSAIPDIQEVITAGKAKLNGIKEFLKFLCFQAKFTIGYIGALNLHRIPQLYNQKYIDYYKKLQDQLNDQLEDLLDENSVLVMPTLPFPAPYNNEILLLYASACYCTIFNVSGMPSTQCPVGFNKEGLPVGVQIASRKGNDYLTIACAQEVEKAFGGWKPPS